MLSTLPVIIHRDLKLANILLRPPANAKPGGVPARGGVGPSGPAAPAASGGSPSPGELTVAVCDFGLSSSFMDPGARGSAGVGGLRVAAVGGQAGGGGGGRAGG